MNKYDGTEVEHWNWCKERPQPYEDLTFGAYRPEINANVEQIWATLQQLPPEISKIIFFRLKRSYGVLT